MAHDGTRRAVLQGEEGQPIMETCAAGAPPSTPPHHTPQQQGTTQDSSADYDDNDGGTMDRGEQGGSDEDSDCVIVGVAVPLPAPGDGDADEADDEADGAAPTAGGGIRRSRGRRRPGAHVKREPREEDVERENQGSGEEEEAEESEVAAGEGEAEAEGEGEGGKEPSEEEQGDEQGIQRDEDDGTGGGDQAETEVIEVDDDDAGVGGGDNGDEEGANGCDEDEDGDGDGDDGVAKIDCGNGEDDDTTGTGTRGRGDDDGENDDYEDQRKHRTEKRRRTPEKPSNEGSGPCSTSTTASTCIRNQKNKPVEEESGITKLLALFDQEREKNEMKLLLKEVVKLKQKLKMKKLEEKKKVCSCGHATTCALESQSVHNETSTSHKKPNRTAFTLEEDLCILKFVEDNPNMGTRGNAMWRQLATQVTTHTWQSLRSRYLHIKDKTEADLRKDHTPIAKLPNCLNMRPIESFLHDPQNSSIQDRNSFFPTNQHFLHTPAIDVDDSCFPNVPSAPPSPTTATSSVRTQTPVRAHLFPGQSQMSHPYPQLPVSQQHPLYHIAQCDRRTAPTPVLQPQMQSTKPQNMDAPQLHLSRPPEIPLSQQQVAVDPQPPPVPQLQPPPPLHPPSQVQSPPYPRPASQQQSPIQGSPQPQPPPMQQQQAQLLSRPPQSQPYLQPVPQLQQPPQLPRLLQPSSQPQQTPQTEPLPQIERQHKTHISQQLPQPRTHLEQQSRPPQPAEPQQIDLPLTSPETVQYIPSNPHLPSLLQEPVAQQPEPISSTTSCTNTYSQTETSNLPKSVHKGRTQQNQITPLKSKEIPQPKPPKLTNPNKSSATKRPATQTTAAAVGIVTSPGKVKSEQATTHSRSSGFTSNALSQVINGTDKDLKEVAGALLATGSVHGAITLLNGEDPGVKVWKSSENRALLKRDLPRSEEIFKAVGVAAFRARLDFLRIPVKDFPFLQDQVPPAEVISLL
ncbi:hypothetical protein Pelo_646 [Pelomyxa schiedti]|nr:hypothetical protein Pelo_646 [Pelomyxa schiedti]